MSQQGKVFRQQYYRNLNTLRLCRPVLLSGNFESVHVGAGEVFSQRYYRNLNNLSLCRSMLVVGNLQSKHVVAGESIQTSILSEL